MEDKWLRHSKLSIIWLQHFSNLTSFYTLSWTVRACRTKSWPVSLVFFFFFCEKYIQAFKIEFTLNSNFKFFSLYYILIISCHVLLFHLLITYFLITNFEATPAKAMIVNTQLHFFQFAKCHLIVFFFFFENSVMGLP